MELKGFLGLVMVPQYICAMLYVLAVAAFVVDVLSKEKRRIHFLTTSFVSYNKGERGIFFSSQSFRLKTIWRVYNTFPLTLMSRQMEQPCFSLYQLDLPCSLTLQ